jgi:hypothetical protein
MIRIMIQNVAESINTFYFFSKNPKSYIVEFLGILIRQAKSYIVTL